MTERVRTNPYDGYYGQARPAPASQSSTQDFLSPKKTLLVLVVVVGCFAVLWPKLFYPMLVANANSHIKPSSIDKTTGCCDVFSEMDIDTIKIMSELCSTIIDNTGKGPLTPKEMVAQCRKAVLGTCGIDISAALQERVSLGHSVKQILEELRSLNGSLCLKYNFGVSPWKLGVPHRITVNLDGSASIRQERPSQLRSEMVHPAFRERGRAIPQPEASVARRSIPTPKIVEGRPGPIPGMRPTMGGAGHVVPAKQQNNGFMGVLMPIYTIGFIIFFTYTIMKLVFKKKPESYTGAPLYPPVETDDDFQKEVFESNQNYYAPRPNSVNSKIVVNAVSALLEEVDQEIQARRSKTGDIQNEQDAEIKVNGSLPKEEDQGTVKVMGMETTASCEGGKKWSRPDSPVLPHPPLVAPKEPSPPPHQIFLEGSLPPQSQILVADSATEAQKHSEANSDDAVVLAGKMTLSVISLDSEIGTDDSLNIGKHRESSEEERRTSSSNVSEEFEKINASELEDQINNIIEEAENIASIEDSSRRYSLSEEINQKEEKSVDVIEEIKNQLNLEDDLLEALRDDDRELNAGLPVTDIIKEFLENEDIALIAEAVGKEAGVKDDAEVKNQADLLLQGLVVRDEDDRRKYEECTVLDAEVDRDVLKRKGEKRISFVDAVETSNLVEQGDDRDMVNQTLRQNGDTNGFAEGDVRKTEESDLVDRENQEKGNSLEGNLAEKKISFEDFEVKNAIDDILVKEVDEADETQNSPVEETSSHKVEAPSFEELEIVKKACVEDAEDGFIAKEIESMRDTAQKNEEIISLENEQALSKDIEVESDVQEEENYIQDRPIIGEDSASDDLVKTEKKIEDQIAQKEDKDIVNDSSKQTEPEKSENNESNHLELEEVNNESNEDDDERENKDLDLEVEEINEGVDQEGQDGEEDEEALDNEIRAIEREDLEERISVERLNGEDVDGVVNGVENSETAAENEFSDEDLENENDDDDDDDEEIEEIIEYVDNTDDEGEEVIEIDEEARHLRENGTNEHI